VKLEDVSREFDEFEWKPVPPYAEAKPWDSNSDYLTYSAAIISTTGQSIILTYI
jgi:hypothetical protein